MPAIAAEFGLKVTLGIWIDKNEARNEREIQAAIALARRYSNVNAIVVGNETTLRADKTIDELKGLIQRVKRMSPVPVTTGEIWTVWRTTRSSPPPSTSSPRTSLNTGSGFPRKRWSMKPSPSYNKLRAILPRQAHRDRGIRMAERRLQHAQGQPWPYRAGGRAARLHLACRGLWHRLQHHRSLRPAMEDQ